MNPSDRALRGCCPRRLAGWLGLGLLLLAAAGSAKEAVRPYQPHNFTGEPGLPSTLRRVVLLPVCAGRIAPPETADRLDQTLVRALQGQLRFEVVTLSRDESRAWFRAAEFSSAQVLPPDLLPRLAAKFAADAVLLVDLTAYQAYRPLAVGFRARLIATGPVRTVWAFDEVISARDPGVAASARRQYAGADRGGEPVDLSATVLQNPARFAGFAAGAMFATLPPR